MATTLNVASNYAGKEAGEIIGASFKEADTLRLGLITVAENVNYKLNMRRIRYTDGTTDYSCGDFTPAGAVTLNERILEPKKLMNPFQVCKETFRQTWSSDLMGASAHNDNMASDIQAAILAEVLASQAEKTDADIWSGDASNDGEFDGFITLFEADANVIKANDGITPLEAPITEANVESELKKVLAAIPVALRRKAVQVAVSPDVFQAYSFYLVSKGISQNGDGAEKQARFGKYTLTEVNGLPENTIVVFEKKNMLFGTGLLADHNDIRVVDEDEIGLLTGQVRGKMVYNAGVQYYNSEDIVYYLSTTVAP
jgi:hypothetical protein